MPYRLDITCQANTILFFYKENFAGNVPHAGYAPKLY